MSKSMKEAFAVLENLKVRETEIKKVDPIMMIDSQLSDFSPSIRAAAKDGYKSGQVFRQTKTKECPYNNDTREYKFWNRGFDCGIQDSKFKS